MVQLKEKKHLFFDLDNTLWDFDINSTAALSQLFDYYQLREKLGTSLEEFLRIYYETNLQLWQQLSRREITKTQLRHTRFDQTFRAFGHVTETEYLSVSHDYLKLAPRGTALLKDCKSTLTYLQTKYQLHLITNGFAETQHIKLDTCGLRPFFKAIVISDEHQCLKPEPEIFRIAEELAGAETSDCVMIGDNLDSDINGAINAGWEAVYFSPTDKSFSGHSISELSELLMIF
jgi:putative hydrolase of the HAD superfamily